MTQPTQAPIGLALTRSAKTVERAFDAALAAAGSSRPVWTILMCLKASPPKTQIELAESVGIRGATLSHHLNAMEADGLISRTRNPDNRRVHIVVLTAAGETLFTALVGVARAHDKRLRAGLGDEQLSQFRQVLDQLQHNIDR